MNIQKTIQGLQNDVATLAENIKTVVKALNPSASVAQTTDRRAEMAFAATDNNSDPNIVRVNVTEGYVQNRMTLPREIYVKSRRDSYDHSDKSVGDPSKSYVTVDGTKYPQTVNQGRSSKIQVSTFGAKAGQTIVFTKVKGNIWESVVKGKSTSGPVVTQVAKSGKGKGVSLAKPTGKGKSAGSFPKNTTAVKPPASKGQAKSQSKAASSTGEGIQEALGTAVNQIKANVAKGFVNDNIVNFCERMDQSPTPRCYLSSAQNKAVKDAAKESGVTLAQVDKALRKHFGWAA